jgi:succinyl-CoA synthetase beta subunit
MKLEILGELGTNEELDEEPPPLEEMDMADFARQMSGQLKHIKRRSSLTKLMNFSELPDTEQGSPASPMSPASPRRQIAFALGLKEKTQLRSATRFFKGLYNAYVQYDCSMAEINPLVVTGAGEVLALDAKISFDSNALYRHKDVVEMRDLSEEDPSEVEAGEHGLSFIKLDGNIGCMVNGAGLAMATMDTIKLHGGEPANFLDVGGGATTEKVKAAFSIITSDPGVKAIFVNIFGGIMKCDTIAQGVIEAARDTGLAVPLVVRLAGTNVELGKKLLQDSGLPIIAADSMGDGAREAVAAAGA